MSGVRRVEAASSQIPEAKDAQLAEEPILKELRVLLVRMTTGTHCEMLFSRILGDTFFTGDTNVNHYLEHATQLNSQYLEGHKDQLAYVYTFSNICLIAVRAIHNIQEKNAKREISTDYLTSLIRDMSPVFEKFRVEMGLGFPTPEQTIQLIKSTIMTVGNLSKGVLGSHGYDVPEDSLNATEYLRHIILYYRLERGAVHYVSGVDSRYNCFGVAFYGVITTPELGLPTPSKLVSGIQEFSMSDIEQLRDSGYIRYVTAPELGRDEISIYLYSSDASLITHASVWSPSARGHIHKNGGSICFVAPPDQMEMSIGDGYGIIVKQLAIRPCKQKELRLERYYTQLLRKSDGLNFIIEFFRDLLPEYFSDLDPKYKTTLTDRFSRMLKMKEGETEDTLKAAGELLRRYLG